MMWPLTVPVLDDGTVTLRAHTPSDVESILQMSHDPATLEWTSISPDATYDTSWEFAMKTVPQGWNEGTAYRWAIEARDDEGTSRFAGNIDIRGRVVADIGVVLHPWARGRGIMSAAVRLAVDWAMNHGDVEVIHWRCYVGNEASLRLAHATGFTPDALIPAFTFERDRIQDAWTSSIRFGDAPYPRTPWAESAPISTPRLALRALRADDLPRHLDVCRDPVAQHAMPHLRSMATPTQARAYLDRSIWQAARGERATWAITDPATDRYLGDISVMDMTAGHGDGGEIGYWLHPDARGNGFASEAVRGVVDYALDPDGLDRRRLTLYAATGNVASRRAAESAGFTHYGTQSAAELLGDGTYDDLECYELLRP
jgi:ribosomal-protein-alanine N-acetyltransferase